MPIETSVALPGAPSAFYTLGPIAIDENTGFTDLLSALWQRPDANRIVLVMVSISPTSGAGAWRSDGPGVSSASDGSFFPAGGGLIYLYSLPDVRNFRIRNNAGATGSLFVQAYGLGL